MRDESISYRVPFALLEAARRRGLEPGALVRGLSFDASSLLTFDRFAPWAALLGDRTPDPEVKEAAEAAAVPSPKA